MNYVKSLIFNFLVVFFVDYLIPGIDVVNQTKLPHIGGDLIFAGILGLLNSLLVPLLKMWDGYLTVFRVSIASLVLNFAAYALLKILPLGVFVTNVEGYIAAALVVSIGSIILGYGEIRRHRRDAHHKHDEPQV